MTLRSIPWAVVCVAVLAADRPAAGQSTVKAGGEFRVSQYTAGDQRLPAAVAGPDGTYLVVWEGQYQDGDSFGVFGRFVSALGVPLGPEFQVNQATGSDQKQPSVAADPAGRYTVAWTGQDVSGGGVFARQYTVAGPLGPEFRVNVYTTSDQFLPKVSAGPFGFGVVWQSAGQDGSGMGVYGRLFGPTGAPATDEFLLSNTIIGNQTAPVIAALDNGRYAVAWFVPSSSIPEVFSRLFDGAGSPLVAERAVASGSSPIPGQPYRDHVAIAAGPAGTYHVSWWEAFTIGGKFGLRPTDEGVLLRLHAANGEPTQSYLGAGGAGSSTTARWQGALAPTFAGKPLVAYTAQPGVLPCIAPPVYPPCPPFSPEDGSGGAVFVRAVGADGPPPRVLANTYTASEQSQPAVASDPYGNALVVWTSLGQDGDASGVYAQRFGGFLAASLAVDPAGNGVIDLGVDEEVLPSWRNFSGAARTFGGTTFGYSGPAGATYTVQDGTASYGTVADGAAQQCINCFVVRVSLPGPRPATHMDSYLGETLTPAEFSVYWPWQLHVGGSFADVSPASVFYRYIETLLHNGITSGCGSGSYCASSSTTRAQMSVFVLLSKEGAFYSPPACTTPVFADVPAGSPFCRWIEELARRGVTSGCTASNFCPDAPVTREQMAVFVLRTLDPALDPPACTTPVFSDVPASSPFCRWIEELARRGVVGGCAPQRYCPQDQVTREQMAVFLSATFGLRLY